MKQPNFYRTGLFILILIVLVVGIFFRFANLDRKVYWHDEALSSLRIAGYTSADRQAITDVLIDVDDLQNYHQPPPEAGVLDTINALAIDNPQHPPLYYVLARLWLRWFDNPVVGARSAAAAISLLVFPCMYWLCVELFGSTLAGWLAVGLIAISPLQMLYAQEAREYSIWAVTILASSAVLLRAMRLKTIRSWVLYSSTLALGFYAFPLSGLVAIGHGLYAILIERFRLSRTIVAYLLASLAATVAFLPWLFVIVTKFSRIQETLSFQANQKVMLLPLVKNLLRNLSFNFVDVQPGSVVDLQSTRDYLLTYVLALLISILVAYALYFLWHHTAPKVWLFILSLMLPITLFLVAPDLILGGQRSNIARYFMPCYLAIQLAVAYLLSCKIFSPALDVKRQRLWQGLTVTLFSLGIVSCTISAQSDTWWNKYSNYYVPEVAQIVNQAPRPLLINDTPIGHILALSYHLNPNVQLKLVNMGKQAIEIPAGYSDIFWFNPYFRPPGLQALSEHNYNVKLVHKRGKLWQLEPVGAESRGQKAEDRS